jgi:hypothetical protein
MEGSSNDILLSSLLTSLLEDTRSGLKAPSPSSVSILDTLFKQVLYLLKQVFSHLCICMYVCMHSCICTYMCKDLEIYIQACIYNIYIYITVAF